jgi:hypothetical protein
MGCYSHGSGIKSQLSLASRFRIVSDTEEG